MDIFVNRKVFKRVSCKICTYVTTYDIWKYHGVPKP